MIGSVGAVQFEDAAQVETARCYADGCTRMLVFDAQQWPADLLGWRKLELRTGDKWGSRKEWRCREHEAVPLGR